MSHPVELLHGDALDVLAILPAASVQCVVTSPPYFGLRSYLPDGHPDKDREIGLQPTIEDYVARLVAVFREVRRVLRDDGTVWLNLGDSYAQSGSSGPQGGSGDRASRTFTAVGASARPSGTVKPKDLIGIPWRVAFALQADGWWLRSDIIWAKPNSMPESVTDRPTRAHEYVFLVTKAARYYYDAAAIAEPMAEASAGRYAYAFGGAKNETLKATDKPTAVVGSREATANRNRRTVWTITAQPYPGAHFATFPEKLVEPCVLAGSRPGDTVLDPFVGSGTVAAVAARLGRRAIGIDLNAEYLTLARQRLAAQPLALPLEGMA